jgi:hypothetical protein
VLRDFLSHCGERRNSASFSVGVPVFCGPGLTKYSAVVNAMSGLLSSIVYLIAYAVVFNDDLLFATSIHGLASFKVFLFPEVEN